MLLRSAKDADTKACWLLITFACFRCTVKVRCTYLSWKCSLSKLTILQTAADWTSALANSGPRAGLHEPTTGSSTRKVVSSVIPADIFGTQEPPLLVCHMWFLIDSLQSNFAVVGEDATSPLWAQHCAKKYSFISRRCLTVCLQTFVVRCSKASCKEACPRLMGWHFDESFFCWIRTVLEAGIGKPQLLQAEAPASATIAPRASITNPFHARLLAQQQRAACSVAEAHRLATVQRQRPELIWESETPLKVHWIHSCFIHA